ncbi:hypothetical protein EDC01DRAFT_648813 [Geopyxis carbonaria]|nr:hypothetical protein EDC01DRAFT_648813 [Geopyxis carbonaria]
MNLTLFGVLLVAGCSRLRCVVEVLRVVAELHWYKCEMSVVAVVMLLVELLVCIRLAPLTPDPQIGTVQVASSGGGG